MKQQSIQWMSREEIEALAREMNLKAAPSREANPDACTPVAQLTPPPVPLHPPVPSVFDIGSL